MSSLAAERKQDRLRAKLVDLRLKKLGNNLCADCGANGPTWASYNLGVFICIKCSGHHRAIGTHVTKVRSTKLDRWQADWVQNMECIGNRIANYLFEGKLTPAEKIDQWVSDSMRGNFIRAKYERRKWFLNRPISELDNPKPAAKATPAKPAPTKPSKAAPAPAKPAQADLLNFGAPKPSSEPPSGMFAGLAIANDSAQPAAPAPRPAPARKQPSPQNANDAPQLLDFTAGEAAPPVQRSNSDDSVDLLSLAPAPAAPATGQSAFGFLNTGPAAPPAQPVSSGFGFLNAAPAAQPAPASSGSAFGFLNQPAPATRGSVPLAPTPAAPTSSSAFGFLNQPAPVPSQPSVNDSFLTSLPQPAKPRVPSGSGPMMPQQPMRPMRPQQPIRPMAPQQPIRGYNNQSGIFGDAMADLLAPAATSPERNSKKRNSGRLNSGSGSPKKTSNSVQGDPFGKLLSGTGLKSP